MRYTQFTDAQVKDALLEIGAPSIDSLFSTIPDQLRLHRELAIPRGLSEPELLEDTRNLAGQNNDCDQLVCFMGAGAYDHFIPTVVDDVATQSEFLTAYTPYQAEASQGLLQLFFEFQTMVCQITGMDAANASMYEVASATAEAVVMAVGITNRSRVVVADSLHPDTRQVVETYATARDIELVRLPVTNGVIETQALQSSLDDSVAAVVVQSPNFFGCIEQVDLAATTAHHHGALLIVVTDPLAAGILKTPGELGADVVVAEGQALGVPLQYGGPYLGLLAARKKFLRKMPGRVVGMAKDGDGRRGFCLILQAREQHIKRERATSNICTNQGLLAVRAAVYLATVGKSGFGEVASQAFDKAHYAADHIKKLEGYELRYDAPFFKEFVVKTSRGVDSVLKQCRARGILGGVPLGRFNSDWGDCFSVAVTEKRTKAEIDDFIAVLESA